MPPAQAPTAAPTAPAAPAGKEISSTAPAAPAGRALTALAVAALLLANGTANADDAIPVTSLHVDTAVCGRKYEGIGALLASDAPWLKAYPEPQRSDIFDVLFRPGWAAGLQVLKLEIGGDGQSTTNTESSHMHSEFDPPSFRRGWINWVLTQAIQRNPDLRVGGLAWTWPHWTAGSVDKKVHYLVTWCLGIQSHYNVTVEFVGLQNEALVTGGNVVFATALRKGLDSAGLNSVTIDCCDSHDFSFLPDLANRSAPFFQAVGALAVHEPLRNAESVPAAALATGKPIWSSEAYTTYSDSNGAGCWARAISWGYVKGNITRHIAWNLIQSYPADGDGFGYDGHGLTWAVSPWSGKYIVAPPIWASAHYTAATAHGWEFLRVGSGSGMLPAGGSYVSLVSPGGCGRNSSSSVVGRRIDYTLIIQTMEWGLSKCFKDSHPPFAVVAQNASFRFAHNLLTRLLESQAGGNETSSTMTRPQSLQLFIRRTRLYRDDVVDPVYDVPLEQRPNRYFEEVADVQVGPDGTFVVPLGVNEIWTLSTVQMHRGDDSSGVEPGLAPIPDATDWPYSQGEGFCHSLSGLPVDAPLVDAVIAVNNQGVFESAPSRDPNLNNVSGTASGYAALTTIQQVVPSECEEWHHGGYRYPQTYVGPPLNLTAQAASCSCSILPPAFKSGWGGIGIAGQAKVGTSEVPGPEVFAVWPNASWRFLGHSGTLARKSATEVHSASDHEERRAGVSQAQELNSHAPDSTIARRWYNLSLSVTPNAGGTEMSVTAAVDGQEVLTNVPLTASYEMRAGPFVFLASSYSTPLSYRRGDPTDDIQPYKSNAEFRNLCFKAKAVTAKRHTIPAPSPSLPTLKGDGDLQVTECKSGELSQLWIFSGEDVSLPGRLRPQSNKSLCLDALRRAQIPTQLPIRLQECGETGSAEYAEQLWHFDSASGVFSSVVEAPCLKKQHGLKCHVCLGYQHTGVSHVDLWDCNNQSTEAWEYDVRAGGAQITKRGEPGCLVVN